MIESRQTNRFQMLLSTQNYLDNNQTQWSAIPILNTFKADLDDLIQDIREQLKTTGVDTSGMTSSKKELKEQIAEKAGVLFGALSAYAAVSGKDDLLNQGDINKSEVMRLRDVSLPDVVQSFIELLNSEVSNLADYGVTKAQIKNLAASVDDFREQVGQPRLKRSASNAAKREAVTLIEDGLEILKEKMDNVMLQFKHSNSKFYEGYQSARVIVD